MTKLLALVQVKKIKAIIKKHLKKNLFVNLLELIRPKKAVMQTMKPVEYKHLLVSLKTKNKRTRRQNKKTKT